MKPWYKQRKFWLAVVSFALMMGNQFGGWGVDTEKMLGIISPLIAWILGEAIVDAKK